MSTLPIKYVVIWIVPVCLPFLCINQIIPVHNLSGIFSCLYTIKNICWHNSVNWSPAYILLNRLGFCPLLGHCYSFVWRKLSLSENIFLIEEYLHRSIIFGHSTYWTYNWPHAYFGCIETNITRQNLFYKK